MSLPRLPAARGRQLGLKPFRTVSGYAACRMAIQPDGSPLAVAMFLGDEPWLRVSDDADEDDDQTDPPRQLR